MIVADSSPLIMLGKQGLLPVLKKCFSKVIIPKSVYDEIMRKEGNVEATALEKAINAKWIVVEKTKSIRQFETKSIGQGEKEAIFLAVKHKCLLIIDDDSARAMASIFGVRAHGTLFVIYLACRKKLISEEEAIDSLDSMIGKGFYVSSDVYAKFLELLKLMRNKRKG